MGKKRRLGWRMKAREMRRVKVMKEVERRVKRIVARRRTSLVHKGGEHPHYRKSRISIETKTSHLHPFTTGLEVAKRKEVGDGTELPRSQRVKSTPSYKKD